MRSIERRFNSLQHKRPNVGSLLNLAGAVKGQHFSTDRISRSLTRLVEKDDYSRSDRPALMRHLVALSQNARGHEAYGKGSQNKSLRGKNALS